MSIPRLAVILAVLTSLVGFAFAGPTSASTGTVSGLVVEEGADIVFASVTLRTKTGAFVSSTFSGPGGFTFANVPAGEYTVTAATFDGRSDSEAVSVSAGQTSRVVLTLEAPKFDPVPFPIF